MGKILIKNGRIWDGERFTYADVLTSDKTVFKIAERIDSPADFSYDAKGKTVSAGLVDMHVHMRGIGIDAFGIQAEMSCFPFGVTAAADAGGSWGDKALLDSFMLKNVVFACTDITNNHANFTRTEKLLGLYGDKAVGVKVYFDKTLSEVCDITALKEVCEFARAHGLKVMVHCSHSPTPMPEILGTLSKGDILTHSYHGEGNTAGDDGFNCLMQAKQRGVIIDVGFAGHVHTDFGVLSRAIECGAKPDTISTDITRNSAYTRGGKYGMTMCMSIAKSLGMTETEIFKAVTSAPALSLGKENEWGYLKEGRHADIAVFDYANEGFDLTDKAGNRVQSDTGYRCVLTVSDGQIVYKY